MTAAVSGSGKRTGASLAPSRVFNSSWGPRKADRVCSNMPGAGLDGADEDRPRERVYRGTFHVQSTRAGETEALRPDGPAEGDRKGMPLRELCHRLHTALSPKWR